MMRCVGVPLGLLCVWAVDACGQIEGPLPAGRRPSVASYDELRSVNESADANSDVARADFDRGWWQPMVHKPLDSDQPSLYIALDAILVGALDNSKQIQVFRQLPLIRETAIIESDAAFDWSQFLETRWDDTSEPIGNTLTAGAGITRFEDHNLAASGGFRKRTYSGGRLEARQLLGFQDNNSQFFVPAPQGSAKLSLSFTQPLLRGRGKQYNTSLGVLANIDKEVADDELRRQLESHLLEVSRSYWAVYLERAVLYQKLNSFLRGKYVYELLERRKNIDAPTSQIVAAEATLSQRHSELVRARAAVKNAEGRLRSLVNDPALEEAELIPTDAPSFAPTFVRIDESISMALQFRPEVTQSIKQLKAAAIRVDMSKHELLPVLNLITETYVSGLQGDGEILSAWESQFSTGQPSYAVGLEFEFPAGNRAARARHHRRHLELRQLQSQYETTLETIRLEVEVAVRELETSQKELSTKNSAMQARALQLESLTKRWERLPGEGATAALTLENMLIAQERLAQAEFEYLQAQLTYNLAIVSHKRSIGLLLQHEQGRGGAAAGFDSSTQTLQIEQLPDFEPVELRSSKMQRLPPTGATR